mgnify:CR=1 FL=1
MSTQAASLKRKNAPATKAAIDKPPTPAPARKKAVTRPSAPEQAKPAVPRAPVRAAKATTTPAKAAEKATRTAPRPSPAREATLPSLRFHHSHALRERTEQLLQREQRLGCIAAETQLLAPIPRHAHELLPQR